MSLILSPARTSKAEHRSGVPPSKYDRIRDFLAERGAHSFRYRQVLEAIFRHRIGYFSNMTALPLGLRRDLEARFGPTILNLRRVTTRHSDQAEKALYEMDGRHRVEAVALKFKAGWESFCISSQAGCAFGCSFCATGKIGLMRNMTADEITDQLLDFHLLGHTIDSVAFMGMGEPLSNVHLFTALDLMTRKDLFGMSARRITVSTIGVVPSIEKLGLNYPQVNLTVSLHSPFDDQRSLMMPINRKYPIAHLMDALDAHLTRTRRKSYLAYVLINGVNDSPEHAKALAELVARHSLRRELLQISLIRFNQAPSVSEGYLRSGPASIQRFQAVLDRAGVKSTVRASFGNDIAAACGQLSAEYTSKAPIKEYPDDQPPAA
ncbi:MULTISPECIES: radical SAM protein [Pseudomonadota]|uniref:radical SAM protein n=1 Tax=Comamonas jiangduensis TaxID=1194168 RepID=UPI00312C97B8